MDVDLFTVGLGCDKIEAKADSIEARLKARKYTVTRFRTDRVITIMADGSAQWPDIPTIQIIETNCNDASELLADFDLDICCCLYDLLRNRVMAITRFIASCAFAQTAQQLTSFYYPIDDAPTAQAGIMRVAKYIARGIKIALPPEWASWPTARFTPTCRRPSPRCPASA